MSALPIALALLIDAAIGYPNRLFKAIGHPVTWIGALIARLDRAWNVEGAQGRKARGVAALAVVLIASLLPALLLSALLPGGWAGLLLTAILAWPLIAARSLYTHVNAVAEPLARGDTRAARTAVSHIVGRDPSRLDDAGIARASIESLAENASDGVIAPLFWGAVLGLPGIVAYKAINTADSMIGYLTPRHAAFGWAAARLDDGANWIPARLTALLFALASGKPGAVLTCVRADAAKHRSPNAGYPEAAMAAALGVRLSGPRAYHGGLEDQPWVNEGAPDPDAASISTALSLYRRMVMLMGATLLVAGWIWGTA